MQDMIFDSIKEKLYRAGLLPLEKQAQLGTEILCDKLETVLPKAMMESGIDFWLVMGKENNEDPVMKTLFTWDMESLTGSSALTVSYRLNAVSHYRFPSFSILSYSYTVKERGALRARPGRMLAHKLPAMLAMCRAKA
jgi:hypothetical protein